MGSSNTTAGGCWASHLYTSGISFATGNVTAFAAGTDRYSSAISVIKIKANHDARFAPTRSNNVAAPNPAPAASAKIINASKRTGARSARIGGNKSYSQRYGSVTSVG